MHIYDNFLRHSGIVRYRIIEGSIIESLNADHGIDFPKSIQLAVTHAVFVVHVCSAVLRVD